MDKNILREAAILHPDKIMHPYSEIMELCGFEGVCAFAENFGGLTIYVPNVRKIFAGCLVEKIAQEYNGYNARRLAAKYGYSERGLKKMLERQKNEV